MMYDGPKAGKWADVSVEAMEAFLASKSLSVSLDGVAWYMHWPDGRTTTLGNPQSRADAVWIAYDLINDPPPNRVTVQDGPEVPEGYFYEQYEVDDEDLFVLYRGDRYKGPWEEIYRGDYLTMLEEAKEHAETHDLKKRIWNKQRTWIAKRF